MITPATVTNHRSEVAECPTWHPNEKALYWTDLGREQLLRYSPTEQETEIVCDGVVVGGFTVQENDSLLLFMDNGSVGVFRNGTLKRDVLTLPDVETRFNDVSADPEGRVLCGTMPDDNNPGQLYRLNVDGTFDPLLKRVQVPNGIGFSPDFDRLYFTETNNRLIHSFEYDVDTGSITNRDTFADFRDSAGKPDGLTVDSAGRVWSAQWGGGTVDCFTETGELAHRLGIPARNVTSATFGGDDFDALYISTAQLDLSSTERGGYIFTVDIDIAGQEPCQSDVDI